ncbi:MAG: P-type conjugative transfer protein TrbL [Fretibacterium sp.]|nr:P-type conjugative transfer protein TrbL [Fretibacterium sp.]
MRRGVLLILITAALLSVTAAWAAATTSYGIDSTLDYVQNFTKAGSGMMETVLRYARNLFIGLATLSLALGLIRMLLNGESNLGTVAAHLAKWILYTGVFSWIMSHDVPQTIINSFVAIGGRVGGQDSIAPDNILSAGIRMYGSLVEKGWNAGWGDFIGVTLLGVIILVVIAMIAGTFALALIEMHLVICGGAVLLGFGGFDYTRNIAMSYLRYVISVGVKLLMVMALYGLANSAIPNWESSFSAATDMTALITAAGQILGGVICIYMAVRHIPDIAQSVVNRASMSFGHPAAQLVYASVSGMPTVSAQNGGGFLSALMDALQGARRPRNSQPQAETPAAPGPAESIEGYAVREYVRGQDGMLSGAGYNPLSNNQAARLVGSPANAGAMTNYVPSAAVYGAASEQRAPVGLAGTAPIVGQPMSPQRQVQPTSPMPAGLESL